MNNRILFGILGLILGIGFSLVLSARRPKTAGIRIQNVNRLTGLFFSEIGSPLLAGMGRVGKTFESMRSLCAVKMEWTDRDFAAAKRALRDAEFDLAIGRGEIHELRHFLIEKGDLLIRLFEHPSLEEQDRFTELLRASLHLREELIHREDIYNIPETDLAHLTNDIRRVYESLFVEWIDHLQHLKRQHPYQFSLAVRLSPFSPDSSAIVQ